MTSVEKLQLLVGAWPGVSIRPHRGAGREFRFRDVELGHVHPAGELDLPFSREIRDALTAGGHAEPHRWLPDSGWTTFRIQGDGDLQHAVWLLRLAWLRQSLKVAADSGALFAREQERLQLDPALAALVRPPAPLVASGRV